MSTKFGECLAPPGARIPHEKCPGRRCGLACTCPCHGSNTTTTTLSDGEH